MKLPRPRLTYANVVSTLCLFILLGGGAYAATKLPKNSVGRAQIRKHAVTKAKLSASVIQALGAPGAASPGPKGKTGPRGKTGATGATGPAGQLEAFITSNFPEAPPQNSKSEEFTLAHAGKPFVFAAGTFTAYCTDEGSEVEVGLFVDGKPVNGNVEQIPTHTSTRLNLFGLGPQIAAGKHTVAIGFNCENGTMTDLETGNAEPAIGGFLFGG